MFYEFNSNLHNDGIELKPVICELDTFLTNAKRVGAVDITVFDSRRNANNKVVQFTLNEMPISIMAIAQ